MWTQKWIAENYANFPTYFFKRYFVICQFIFIFVVNGQYGNLENKSNIIITNLIQ
jgi:hypothetical protein